MADLNNPDDKIGDSVHPVPSTSEGVMTKPIDESALDEAAKYLANTEEYPPSE
jgi:hypothetical protein